MGLMSFIHRQLLRRGRLIDLLPDDIDRGGGDAPEIEAAKAEIQVRMQDEREISGEVEVAIVRLHELDRKNHYGESLRRAFGGR